MAESCRAGLELDPVWDFLVEDAKWQQLQDDKDRAAEREAAARIVVEPLIAETCEAPPAAAAAEEQEEEQDEAPVYSLDGKDRIAKKGPISAVVDKPEVLPSRFPLLPEAEVPPVTRWDVEGCDAFVLDGVLTPQECAALMQQADGLWSFWDDSKVPRVSFRNAFTVEVTHQELADRIWRRVEHLLTPSLSFAEGDERCEVDIEGTWVPYAMNPKKLLSRYLDGGHFSPHTDGTTVVDFNRRTFYSCVLFLNESPWGGATRIYKDAQMQKELVKDAEGRLTGDPSLVLADVPPKPGRMLAFYHRLMHEGVPAKEKYIIRSDVLYRRTPEQCTAPEDVEAFEMYQEAQLQAEKGECDEAAGLFRRAFKRSPALAKVYRM